MIGAVKVITKIVDRGLRNIQLTEKQIIFKAAGDARTTMLRGFRKTKNRKLVSKPGEFPRARPHGKNASYPARAVAFKVASDNQSAIIGHVRRGGIDEEALALQNDGGAVQRRYWVSHNGTWYWGAVPAYISPRVVSDSGVVTVTVRPRPFTKLTLKVAIPNFKKITKEKFSKL